MTKTCGTCGHWAKDPVRDWCGCCFHYSETQHPEAEDLLKVSNRYMRRHREDAPWTSACWIERTDSLEQVALDMLDSYARIYGRACSFDCSWDPRKACLSPDSLYLRLRALGVEVSQ